MLFDFDSPVNRTGLDSLRSIITSPAIENAGLMTYDCGELEFKTAPSVISAIVARAQNGLLGFTWPGQAYFAAVQWWAKKRRGWNIDPAWVVPTQGTIFSLASAIRLFTQPGQAIAVLPPVYNRYKQAADRTGRTTVEAPLKYINGDYAIDFATLEHTLANPLVKILVLCNPQNPTGNIWPKEDLRKIVALCEEHDVYIYSDEIFADNVAPGLYVPPILTVPGAEKRCLLAWGLGKAFNFTGVNHTHVFIADATLRERFIAQRNADHYGSIDPLTHAAVLGAYSEEGYRWQQAMVEYVSENAKRVHSFFKENLPRVHVCPGSGFIMWVDWTGLALSEDTLMKWLVEDALFQPDAGSHYGAPGFTRMSIGVPRRCLEESLALLLESAKRNGYAG